MIYSIYLGSHSKQTPKTTDYLNSLPILFRKHKNKQQLQMKHQRTIIFDLDGTLIDSLPSITSSIKYAIRQRGHIISDETDLKPLIGPL